jgi:oxalate decarboxylase/phosphoglucose isomerase-like protein (cupin superfamily)
LFLGEEGAEHSGIIEVDKGTMIFIPPYWWYSIQYTSDATLTYSITYNTIANVLANAHHLLFYTLQQFNIKERPAKILHPVATEEISLPKTSS